MTNCGHVTRSWAQDELSSLRIPGFRFGFEFGFGVTAKYADNAAPSPSENRQGQQQTRPPATPQRQSQAGYINGQIKITT